MPPLPDYFTPCFQFCSVRRSSVQTYILNRLILFLKIVKAYYMWNPEEEGMYIPAPYLICIQRSRKRSPLYIYTGWVWTGKNVRTYYIFKKIVDKWFNIILNSIITSLIYYFYCEVVYMEWLQYLSRSCPSWILKTLLSLSKGVPTSTRNPFAL